jgi:hypothetical protein
MEPAAKVPEMALKSSGTCSQKFQNWFPKVLELVPNAKL